MVMSPSKVFLSKITIPTFWTNSPEVYFEKNNRVSECFQAQTYFASLSKSNAPDFIAQFFLSFLFARVKVFWYINLVFTTTDYFDSSFFNTITADSTKRWFVVVFFAMINALTTHSYHSSKFSRKYLR